MAGFLERIKELIPQKDITNYVLVSTSVLILFSMPFTMGYKDYHEHDRTGNYVAWDYAYNMLNSCEPNSIKALIA